MNDFAGRVAVITGTTGIGRAIAMRFAAGGAQVVAGGIETAGNEELARDAAKLRLTLLVEKCDVTDFDQVRSVVTKTVNQFGGLDIIKRSCNSSLRHGPANGSCDLESLHDGERWQHLSDGASRHPGDEKARRRIHH